MTSSSEEHHHPKLSIPKDLKRVPSTVYPLKGVYFFFSHPKELWLKCGAPIILTFIFSAFSIGLSLKVLLPHQVDKLLEWHWPHWMSWAISIVSVILESAALNLLFFMVLRPFFEDMVFDTTLRAKGLGHVIDDAEDVPRLVLCWRSMRSSLLVTTLLLLLKILLLVLTAPLQLIPIAGTILACYINGWPTAWSQHLHYDIEIRSLTVSGSYNYARKNKWDYVNFGALAFGLEIIPVFNIFFMWTNIVGAALWISEEYQNEHAVANGQEPSVGRRGENYPAAQAPSTSNERTPLLSNNNDSQV